MREIAASQLQAFEERTKTGGFYNYVLLDGVQEAEKQEATFCNVGDQHYHLGELDKALHCHQEHLKTVKLEDKAGKESMYERLGKDFLELEDFQMALRFHFKQQSIALEMKDRAMESRASENLGNTYYRMGNFKAAIAFYSTFLQIAEERGDKAEIGRAESYLSNSCRHAGAHEDAILHHCRDLSIARNRGDKAGEGVAHGNLGNIYFSLGLFEKAIECQQLHLNLAKEVGDSVEEGKAWYELGYGYESLDKFDQALDCFRSSLKQFEKLRNLSPSNDDWKINLQNEYNPVNIAVWRILLKQRKFSEALSAAEKGRAPALKDLLKSNNGSGTAQSVLGGEEDIFPHVLSHLSSTTIFLAIDGKEINIWVLLKGSGGLHFEKSELGERSLEEGVALSFASLTRAAYPLTEDEIRFLNAEEAEQRAQQMENALGILYEVVISPVAHLLQGERELIIVPDGPLCVAPFAAFSFLDPNSKRISYLCECFTIRVIPSLTSLQLIADSKEHSSRKDALLVGNPCLKEIVFNKPWNWELPDAEEEVRHIGRILNSEPLIGEAATKEEVLTRLKSTSYPLVHIAAKGADGEIFLAPNPTRKSLEPEEDDYKLTIADVMSIQVHAHLVVLSCCHSIQGTIKSEGVVGFARAFLAKGARCVLVSSWEIKDKATLELMKKFYEHLVGGQKASVALNQAMKYLKESTKFGAVKYWAAFQLIGDDVTLEIEDEK